MMDKKAFWLSIILIILLVGGYIIWQNRRIISSAQPIKIGGIYGLTGPVAALGEQVKNGFLLGIEEVNKTGGVDRRKLELIVEDSQFDPKIAVSAFHKLTDLDKVKIIHSLGSSIGLALKPLAEQQGILLFTPAAHPKLTEKSNLVLRHSNIASNDALVLAEEIKRENATKIGIIYVNDDWGQIFESELKKALSGVEIKSENHVSKDTDFRTQLTKLTTSQPDIVVIGSFGSAPGLIIKQGASTEQENILDCSVWQKGLSLGANYQIEH